MWRKIGQNADALDYINKKQPSLQSDSTNCTQSGDFFEALPHHIVTFTYDAVVALGLAACGAQKSMNGEGGVFSGKMQRDFFSRNVFRGASGEFLLRDAFPTRTSDSSYFVMVNMAESMLNTTHISFKDSSLSFFWETGNRTWKMRGDQQFKYPGGGFIAPLEFEAQDEPSRKEQLFWVPLLVGVAISSLAFIGSGIYIHRRRKLVDSIWEVDLKQLEFDEPIEIIGSGTFGLVLLARYRGTDVAVKRVLPPKESEHTEGVASHEGFNPRSSFVDNRSYSSDEWSDDPETGKRNNKGKRPGAASGGHESNPGSNSRWIATTFLRTIKWTDDHTIMKREFIREMRLLSKLRHPNIITVMGAVLSNVHEPMLIMEYMKLGSLYDILHNRSMQLVGETVLPVLRDITQGMRFLHSATPAVIHR